MMVPTTALFVAADEPLLVYSSIGEAVADLEVIDVVDGVYPAAFGPNGEPYSVCTVNDCVFIEPTGEPDKPDDLKRLLLRYLNAVGCAVHDGVPLNTLTSQVWAIKKTWRGV